MFELQRYFDISQAPELATFRSRLIAFANDLDFGIVGAGLAIDQPGKGPDGRFVSVGNAPDDYAKKAQSLDYAGRDPVMRRLKRMNVPFVYDQSLYVKEAASDLWDFQAPYGFANGIAVALHLPAGRHFLLGVDRTDPLPTDDRVVTHMMASLQLLAVHAQDAAQRLFGLTEGAESFPALTTRELEVLRWAMEGKTAWATGEILSISENTVNFHYRSVLRKMNCTSKHQAVLKALAAGLL